MTTKNSSQSAQPIINFISKYAGNSLEQALGIVEDKLMYMRAERQIRMMDRFNDFLKEKNITSLQSVPLKIMVPLLQTASLEEDNYLQDRMAMMLANAVDADSDIEIRRAYISILGEMTPLDVLIAHKIYSIDLTMTDNEDIYKSIQTIHLPDHASLKGSKDSQSRPTIDVEISLGNLIRLGIVTGQVGWGGMTVYSSVLQNRMGEAFMKACS